ncbi:MAG: hypothetical protein K8T25_09760, partial [Planctomycetia bacterium]|nr:hypothetical protein [Planctomycetia bacterium]
MLKTLGIVQLNDECGPQGEATSGYGRRLGGKPLVEWVVRRVTDSSLLDGVIVAAGDTPQQRRLAELVPLDAPVFFGHPTDLLRRFRDAALQYGAESVVRVSTD